ncbi:uncharacterized protein N7484_000411 [Penicillium longicatenatum]|uniref:uncharacterized protein n=1 Tax=Penicillium longicatenatum TaxID=1561947 RepID=UPI0025499397|nr:uncharacterized protein N7484_000411 [Penicillium longicatenatum]KAJ5661039.1 hypothetical protein N7484_000411 [Penicillium longicatenatum]
MAPTPRLHDPVFRGEDLLPPRAGHQPPRCPRKPFTLRSTQHLSPVKSCNAPPTPLLQIAYAIPR